MCGIAGIIGPGAEHLDGLVRGMNALQRHRGPDDEGLYADRGACLGHVRLAILDLTPKGHQPMTTPDGRFTLVYNGEIYNYRALRRELSGVTFRSRTDSEVLLHAFARWGPACLERLYGMFAFAIWDRKIQELFLARDRFGVKPLYYTHVGQRMVFASEIKPLLTVRAPASPNLDVIAEYLGTGQYDHGEATFFSKIFRLLPGHCMRVRADGEVVGPRRYYALPEERDLLEISFEDARERLAELLDTSISRRLQADVPVGLSLSGGVDSSALLALAGAAADGSSPLSVLTIDYDDPRYSERSWVKRMLRHAGVTGQVCVMTPKAAVGALAPTIWHQEEPFGGIPTIGWFALYQQARALGVTVMLDGSGIDDYFAGYQRHAMIRLATLLRESDRKMFEEEAEWFCKRWGVDRGTMLGHLARVTHHESDLLALDGTMPVCRRVIRTAHRHPRASTRLRLAPGIRSALRRNLYFGMQRGKLPRDLRFKDRISMAFSLEARFPFLDHEVVEFVLSLPEHYLIRRGNTKYLFREVLAGRVPEAIRLTGKRSVQTPQREWFQRGPLAELLQDVLEHPSDLLSEMINPAIARRIYRQYRKGRSESSNHLWQWVNLELWYRQFFLEPIAGQAPSWPAARVEELNHARSRRRSQPVTASLGIREPANA